MSEYDEFTKGLEELGEEEVGTKLSQGVWASRRKSWATDWLRMKAASSDDEKKALALSLAAEANAAAQEANRIAEANLKAATSAKNAAWAAAIAAAVAALWALATYVK